MLAENVQRFLETNTIYSDASLLGCTLKPMVAKPLLIANAFNGHTGCAALAIKKLKLASFFMVVIFFFIFTKEEDDKPQIK
jgi:hypothetical protein